MKNSKGLLPHYYTGMVEAGCDEAGRGCLAGSVYAAAVILPPDYDNPELNDSKKLSEKKPTTELNVSLTFFLIVENFIIYTFFNICDYIPKTIWY